MSLRTLHLSIGILGLLVFVLQGQYMALVLNVPELPDTQRMLYRSAHIYLMLASALNLCVGYFRNPADRPGLIEKIASLLFAVAPAVFLVSFFTEVNEQQIDRTLASLGLYGVFFAAALLGLTTLLKRLGKSREP